MAEKTKFRTVVFYKHYFKEFFVKQRQKVKDKILWTLDVVELHQHIPDDYLKHLEGTNGLYEIRVKQSTDIFRILCFFDEGKLVVLANAFQKKTQKTPKQEIIKALKIMDEYYEQK